MPGCAFTARSFAPRGRLPKKKRRLKTTLTLALVISLSAIFACAAAENTSQIFTLADCLNRALERNPAVLRDRKEIERTRGLVIEARAAALPRLNASGYFQAEQEGRLEFFPGSFPGAPTLNETAWQVGLRATQLVYAGGKVGAGVRIAHLLEDNALSGLEIAIEDTLLATHQAFYNALLQQALEAIAAESQRLLTDEVKLQRARKAAGSSTKYEVLRAEVALANADPLLTRARQQRKVALAELARLMAWDAPNGDALGFEVSGNLIPPFSTPSLPEALAAAQGGRGELRQLERQGAAAREQLTVERAGALPQFSIFGGYDIFSSRFGSADSSNGGFIGGVQGNWPIFDGFLVKGRMDQARARISQLDLDRDAQARRIEKEVREAVASVEEARALFLAQRKNIETAQESLRLARVRYKAGAGLQIDTLSSEVALTQARTNELQARYDFNVAWASLQRATGRLARFVDAAVTVAAAETLNIH